METATELSDFSQATAAVTTASPIVVPERMRIWPQALDYYELSKPRMNFLVVVTTAVGFYMASRGLGDWPLLVHTLLGTALTAAGASAFNQYFEREYDGTMLRTRNRPLPAGRLTPSQALAFASLVTSLGVIELFAFVNPLTACLGAATVVSYVLIYTPLKRRTTLCTIIGAVPGAIPIAMGWTARSGQLPVQAVALFAILFLWQMPHFLAIAILYRDDYARGGFKVLPVIDENLRITSRQMILYSLFLVPVTFLPVSLNMAGAVYLAAAIVLGISFIGFAVVCAVSKGRTQARHLFFASIVYLPFLLAAMMLDKV